MAQRSLEGGPSLTGVTFTAWQTRHHGWTLQVRYTWDFAPASAPGGESYDRLTRGELLDVLDAVRAKLELGTEY